MATLSKPALPATTKTKRPAKSSRASRPEQTTRSVSQAKAQLTALLQEIEADGRPITITRRGKPIAQLVPVETHTRPSAFGCMKGTFTIVGDIVGPEPDIWEAML